MSRGYISFRVSSNSEACASELLENLEESWSNGFMKIIEIISYIEGVNSSLNTRFCNLYANLNYGCNYY